MCGLRDVSAGSRPHHAMRLLHTRRRPPGGSANDNMRPAGGVGSAVLRAAGGTARMVLGLCSFGLVAAAGLISLARPTR